MTRKQGDKKIRSVLLSRLLAPQGGGRGSREVDPPSRLGAIELANLPRLPLKSAEVQILVKPAYL
jgi:hypothetical protein